MANVLRLNASRKVHGKADTHGYQISKNSILDEIGLKLQRH